MSSGRGQVSPSGGPIVLCGHLRKLKTLKKKYFVLRGDSTGHPACLEYYDSKKKFDNRQTPKRSISMRNCFNINRRLDTKHTHVIALYTKDECFSLILDSERELEQWLNAMLLLSGDVPDGEQPRPTFEHVWQVTMQKKGLGERKNINGPYRLCLTDRTLSLVKVGAKDNTDSIEFSLVCIRRCGYMDRIFYMEVGRSAVTGGGDFWMEAEDNNIAHNMHSAILGAMSSSSSTANNSLTGNNVGKDDVGPRQRGRSSSANEASKPISVLQRRHTGAKLHGFSPLGATGRDRCDSLPSRARTTSEGHPTPVVLGHPRSGHLAPHVPRPHSMYGRGLSYSPPVSSMPISPASGACSTDSAGSSLSMDDGNENILEEGTTSSRYGHSLTPDEPVILEENPDDYAPWSGAHSQHKYSPNFKSHSPSQQSSYVDMYSPCGSSPGRGGSMTAAYMPMSPATGSIQQHSHSRTSSLVEETTLPDGYVPMAPVGDAGYVDMDPTNGSSHQNHNGHFPDDMSQHGGSSCSVTSGTPSTDLRFSEYHLDKVTSYLAPGEESSSRPTRAYSVGSRPEPAGRHRKNRLDIAQQESSRVRAFSVGSRSKRPEIIGRLASVIASRLPIGATDSSSSNKSNSAPLLSSSWGHNSGCSVTSERMEDLMELDFTRPSVVQGQMNSPPSSSYSHSQSYSTATDTSSYVDMSPGHPQSSTATITTATTVTAPYVDMSGINKINRNNNNNNSSNNNNNNNHNNNNNTTTANHNHNQATTSVSLIAYKPVIKTLKPVEEAEGAYMRMEGSMEDWPRASTSPKQAPSPMQDDYMQMNGPPGVMRTAPVDLPQPRRPPEGYVEMSFKSRPSLEQDYINMSMGSGGGSTGSGPSSSSSRNRTRRQRPGSRSDKSQRSKPIAIQMSSKTTKIPSFLPLNDSPTSESLASTPVSPPRATPTGSNATIFPFSLNSPQSPIKPFKVPSMKHEENGLIHGSTTTMTMTTTTTTTTTTTMTTITGDYATMAPGIPSTSSSMTTLSLKNPVSQANRDEQQTTNVSSSATGTLNEVPQSPLSKRLAELSLSRTKISRNSINPSCVTNIASDDTPTNETAPSCTVDSLITGFRLSNQTNDSSASPLTKRRGSEIKFSKMKTSRSNYCKDETSLPSTSSLAPKTTINNNNNNCENSVHAATTIIGQKFQQELPTSPLTKRLTDLSVVKAKLVQSSPNASPTPSAGFKIINLSKTFNSGSTTTDDGSGGTTPTTTPTPTATPSPLDSEGYEKLQPGATILHYASLDLHEVVGPPPPVSPTPVNEGFSYAEIDFAKLKQN